jgi:putative hydroxymethylpyrimidine transport system substrate-binding protein
MTRHALLCALAAFALVAAGCGEKSQTVAAGSSEPFTVVLDYLPNADHAGIYAAQARGEFRKAGLDVKLVTPADPAAPLRQLQAGRADLALTYEPELLLVRDKGINLVGVSALVTQPLTSIMAVKGSGVRDVRDLQGKTVGTAGIPYQDAYLDTILKRAGVTDVKRVNVGFNLVPAMVSKRVDATLGAFWNVEGVQLQRDKRDPTILKVDDLGVPTYDELVFAAKREELDPAEASKIRRFIQALRRGTEAVEADPAVGADALVAAEPDLDRDTVLAQIKATLPAFKPANPEAPYGFLDPGAWDRYSNWMRANGLITQPTKNADPITTEFLPGQGLPDPQRP